LFGVCIAFLIRVLPKLLAKDVSELLDAKTILMLVLVGGAVWFLGWGLWQLVAYIRASGKSPRRGREGVHWGRHDLLATAESLSVRLPARRSVYRWGAFSGLKKTKNLLLLQLTPRSAVAVPRQAFKSKADEKTFCDFVRSQTSA
jgi:hypothetical protein